MTDTSEQIIKALLHLEERSKARLADRQAKAKVDAMFRSASLKQHLNKLLQAKPETGEQWGEICRIEAEIVEFEHVTLESVYASNLPDETNSGWAGR